MRYFVEINTLLKQQKFAILPIFGSLAQNVTVFFSEKARKGQFLTSYSYVLQQKTLKIFHRTTRGLLLWETLKKNFDSKISVPIFDISACSGECVHTSDDFRKSDKL